MDVPRTWQPDRLPAVPLTRGGVGSRRGNRRPPEGVGDHRPRACALALRRIPRSGVHRWLTGHPVVCRQGSRRTPTFPSQVCPKRRTGWRRRRFGRGTNHDCVRRLPTPCRCRCAWGGRIRERICERDDGASGTGHALCLRPNLRLYSQGLCSTECFLGFHRGLPRRVVMPAGTDGNRRPKVPCAAYCAGVMDRHRAGPACRRGLGAGHRQRNPRRQIDGLLPICATVVGARIGGPGGAGSRRRHTPYADNA